MLKRLISGGQTGVDRGALDAALARGFPCGGACPRGRRSEDGAIPDRYPVIELASSNYLVRTRRNVAGQPGTAPAFDAIATAEKGLDETVLPEAVDISASIPLLVDGENVLSFHAINSAVGDDDFVVRADVACWRRHSSGRSQRLRSSRLRHTTVVGCRA